MKAIMVMFDSLNRRMLPPYGCDWVHAPNFKRLAEKTVTFDLSFVGSMPCMPARREIHTGRLNFLHRSWGPIEPFDDSMPEILRKNSVYTHLCTDHYHYWEDGGATYHHRYSSFEFNRGQEADRWKGVVGEIDIPEAIGQHGGETHRTQQINRSYMPNEEDHYQAKTFADGLHFIKTNANEDNWFLQIEAFDPHEPYFVPKRFRDLYPEDYDGPEFDWPSYKRVDETPEQVRHIRNLSAALHSMCDESLGKVLDMMDEHNMWDDTMLIVNTDHGYLMSEHDWWGKCVQPFYNEVAHTPLFIWDPRCKRKGERCDQLVTTIDLAPTLLDYFGVDIPKDVQGKPLKDTIAKNAHVHDAILFGIHGGHVNVTDGRYVYMRASADEGNGPLNEYTLMPSHMRTPFAVDELQNIELAEPFDFTKGCRVMKIEGRRTWINAAQWGTMLFDIANDYAQEHPIDDPENEQKMIDHMTRLMRENDAPSEQFERLGL